MAANRTWFILVVAVAAAGWLFYKEEYLFGFFLVVVILLFEELPRLTKLTVGPGRMEMQLAEQIGEKNAKSLKASVQRVIDAFEKEKNAYLTPDTREYIEDVIVEGLTLTRDELKQRHGIDADAPEKFPAVEAQVSKALEKILSEVEPTKDHKVPISKLSKGINANYCQIWPFC